MKKILVVDDNEKNRRLIRLLLQKDYEVIEAEDGKHGVEMAKEILPDLILMDIQMPVMNGIEALKHLRANDITAKMFVIAQTSYAMRGDKDKLLEEGFDGYISKPLKKGELTDVIETFLK